jgi:hypothetical protein
MYPRRYRFEDGRHVLHGLTFSETSEFERLEERAPTRSDGSMTWSFEGSPQTPEERRWLNLYQKHERAYEKQRRQLKSLQNEPSESARGGIMRE